jgi:hypothetical protein
MKAASEPHNPAVACQTDRACLFVGALANACLRHIA